MHQLTKGGVLPLHITKTTGGSGSSMGDGTRAMHIKAQLDPVTEGEAGHPWAQHLVPSLVCREAATRQEEALKI